MSHGRSTAAFLVALMSLTCSRRERPSSTASPTASAPPVPAAPAARALSWVEAVRAKAGAEPGFLTWTGAAIVARTPTRPALMTLPTLKADALAWDPALDLFWIHLADRLYVLDLRTTGPKPELIVTGFAEPADFVVCGGGGYDNRFCASSNTCADDIRPLDWTASPSIDVAAAHIVGLAWLAQNRSRRAKKVPEVTGFMPGFYYDEMRIPNKDFCGEAPEACGRMHDFGATGLKLVVAGNIGGCPEPRCLLYDPKTRRYSGPEGRRRWTSFSRLEAGSCGAYLFDESERWYLTADSLCTEDGTCQKLLDRPLGWLDPGSQAGNPGL